MNNITDKDMQNIDKIDKLELVLEDFYRMDQVN